MNIVSRRSRECAADVKDLNREENTLTSALLVHFYHEQVQGAAEMKN